jgi:glutamine synthetase
MFFPAYTDMVPEGLSYAEPLKNIRLLPIKDTYRRLPWTKNQGIVFGRFVYHPHNEPFEGCPRGNLERACANLKELGYSL